MESDTIKSLKSSLAELTCLLFTIGKEIDLIIKQTEDEQVNEGLRQVVSALQDSNSEVIRLYHKIYLNGTDLQNEWYDNEEDTQSLQSAIDNLRNSIETLIAGNQQLLNSMYES